MLMPKLPTGLLTVSIWHRRSTLVPLLSVKWECWCLAERSQPSALHQQKGASFAAHPAHSHLPSCNVLFASWLWSPWGWRSEKALQCSLPQYLLYLTRPILNFYVMQENDRKHNTDSEEDIKVTSLIAEQPREGHTKKSHYTFLYAGANLE